MPESSPELRCRGACWLMRDAERQARRRPLRSLCTATANGSTQSDFIPASPSSMSSGTATTVFDAKVSLPSLLASIGRLRVLSQQEGNVQ